MSEETKTNPRAGAQLTGRVTQATLDKFREIQEAESFETFGQFVESLLMHYYDPVKVNKDNEAEIRSLKAENTRLENDIKAARESLDNKGGDISKLQMDFDELKQAYNEKCAELESVTAKMNEYRGIEHKMDGHILVPVDELDMRCLQYLSDRENETRHREDITPAVFFQYAVQEMLIKGNKFAIPSVPNSKIAQFKKEIANGQ